MTLVERALERSKQAAREREAAEKSEAHASAMDTHPAMSEPVVAPELSSALAPLQIGAAQLRDQHLLPPESLQRRQLIDFRMLRRPILEAADAPAESTSLSSKRLVMVTSSLPAEGKSYVSLNLAISVASEVNRPVLLIDADNIRRALTKAFGLEDAAGFVDLLSNPLLQLRDVIRETSIPRLLVLPAGGATEKFPELLGSEHAAVVFERIGALLGRGLAIVDTPPALLTSETPVLARLVGQLIFVVRAGVTLRDHVWDALERFNGVAEPRLVLNGWEPVKPTDRAYYGTYDEYLHRDS